MDQYWEQRAQEKDQDIDKLEQEYATTLEMDYQFSEIVILGLITKFFAKRDKHTQQFYLNRVDNLMKEITVEVKNVAKKEASLLTKAKRKSYKLSRVFDGRSIKNVKDDYVYKPTDEKRITEVVHKPWSGLTHVERIKKNAVYDDVKFKEIITQGIINGESTDRIAKNIQEQIGKSYKASMRLARTEVNYVVNQSTLDLYKEDGIKYYEYAAILDSRTSNICRNLDNKKFKVSNAQVGVNYPPMHVLCRSTTVPIIEK